MKQGNGKRQGYDDIVVAAPVSVPYERFSPEPAHWWLAQALSALGRQSGMTAEQSHASAKIAWSSGEAVQAARHLQRALRLAPERVEWRFDLAQYYAALEMWTDAKREAVACVRASDDKRFHEFLDSLPRNSQP